MLGLGLSLGLAPIQGVGAWAATRAALKAQTMAYGGIPSTSGSPTFTLGTANAGPTISGTTVDRTDIAFRYSGAEVYVPTGFPDNLGYKSYNVTPDGSGGTKAYVAATFEFGYTGQAMEVYVKGNGARMRLSIDGVYQSANFAQLPNTGSFYYYKVDFGSATPRQIKIEHASNLLFLGIRRETAATISAPTAPTRLRLIVAGDSFTEGTGTLAYDGFAQIAGKLLGFSDIWASGSGGTGWIQTNGSRVALGDRFVQDVSSRTPDVAILAMGLNDEGDGNDASVVTAMRTAIAAQRATKPATMIYVVGPWDPSAPSAPPGGRTSLRDAMQAGCAGLGGVKFFDPVGVSYTKYDTTHPDTAGHVTLGTWLADRIKADLGL